MTIPKHKINSYTVKFILEFYKFEINGLSLKFPIKPTTFESANEKLIQFLKKFLQGIDESDLDLFDDEIAEIFDELAVFNLEKIQKKNKFLVRESWDSVMYPKYHNFEGKYNSV